MYEVDQYTVSLLHFDDELKDECGIQWNGIDTVQFSSDVRKMGRKSISFTSDSAKISPYEYIKLSGLNPNGTFSIDCWVYIQEVKDQLIFGMKFNDTIYNMFEIGITKNNTLEVGTNRQPTGAWVSHDTTNVVQINAWNYIYVAITPETIYTGINGKIEKFTNDLLKYNNLTELSIGNRCKNESDGYTFRGYIDEFRISNIVRWTEDFIPPTETAPVSGEFLLVVTMAEEVEKNINFLNLSLMLLLVGMTISQRALDHHIILLIKVLKEKIIWFLIRF